MEKGEKNHVPTQSELGPDGLSRVGFLKEDQTLAEVIQRDKKALELLGYTTQEVASLVGQVVEMASSQREFDYLAPNGKEFSVKVAVWRGMQTCPWQDSSYSKGSNGGIDLYLTEKGKVDEPTHIAGLIPHLIEEHEFFEGGPYRVPPEKIIELFGKERIQGSFEKVKELKI